MADSFGFAVDDVTQLPSFGIWSSVTHGRCFGMWMSHEVLCQEGINASRQHCELLQCHSSHGTGGNQMMRYNEQVHLDIYDLKQVAIAPRLFPYFDLSIHFTAVCKTLSPVLSILHSLQLQSCHLF